MGEVCRARDTKLGRDVALKIYVGNSGTQLFVRAMDALEARAIFRGTPRGPFTSPDGQWIGFIDDNNVLKKVAVTGGPSVTIARGDGAQGAADQPSTPSSIIVVQNWGEEHFELDGRARSETSTHDPCEFAEK